MKKVALIAGHRGPGTGAKGNGLDEGAETIILRDLIEDYLLRYNVVPIVDQEKQDLKGVVAQLKKTLSKEDMCIDIHFNASSNTSATGVEVLIPCKNTPDEMIFAKKLLTVVCDTLVLKSRGVKTEGSGQHSSLAMLSGFDCCNILLEVCFVSNESDVESYFANRSALAENIAKLILNSL